MKDKRSPRIQQVNVNILTDAISLVSEYLSREWESKLMKEYDEIISKISSTSEKKDNMNTQNHNESNNQSNSWGNEISREEDIALEITFGQNFNNKKEKGKSSSSVNWNSTNISSINGVKPVGVKEKKNRARSTRAPRVQKGPTYTVFIEKRRSC